MRLFQVKALAAIGERSAYARAAANLYGMPELASCLEADT
jgi:hypothetical protein